MAAAWLSRGIWSPRLWQINDITRIFNSITLLINGFRQIQGWGAGPQAMIMPSINQVMQLVSCSMPSVSWFMHSINRNATNQLKNARRSKTCYNRFDVWYCWVSIVHHLPFIVEYLLLVSIMVHDSGLKAHGSRPEAVGSWPRKPAATPCLQPACHQKKKERGSPNQNPRHRALVLPGHELLQCNIDKQYVRGLWHFPFFTIVQNFLPDPLDPKSGFFRNLCDPKGVAGAGVGVCMLMGKGIPFIEQNVLVNHRKIIGNSIGKLPQWLWHFLAIRKWHSLFFVWGSAGSDELLIAVICFVMHVYPSGW